MEEFNPVFRDYGEKSAQIVMLRGTGCRWKRCAFCDYHWHRADDEAENFALNRAVLSRVTGQYHHLEVINSGSFGDLDEATMEEILRVCRAQGISPAHFECHWIHRGEVPALRERFERAGITVKVKTGVETFDRDFREKILHKGIGESDPAKIAGRLTNAAFCLG